MRGCWILLLLAPIATRAEPLRAHYATYAAGLNVVQMDALMDFSGERYRLDLEFETAGTFALLNKTRLLSRADGRFAGGAALPLRFYSAGTMRGERRQTLIDYESGQPALKELSPPNEAEREEVPEELRRNTIDSLSAMAQLIEQVNRSGRCEGSARTFDGRRLGQMRAWTLGEENLAATDRSSFAGPALHCAFEGRQVAGFRNDESRERQQRPQQGGAWFAVASPGGPKIPVRISFHTRWFGDAVMYLAPKG